MRHPALAFACALSLLAATPAMAKPGAPLDSYKVFLTKTLKLKAGGVKRVAGGSASDWLYSFTGKSPKGVPLEATVQVGSGRIYSQALSMTTKSADKVQADEVARLVRAFWQESLGKQGAILAERTLARQIAKGQAEAWVKRDGLLLTLNLVRLGPQAIWVAGIEREVKGSAR